MFPNEIKKRALFFRLQCPVLKLKRGPVSKPPVTVASQLYYRVATAVEIFSVTSIDTNEYPQWISIDTLEDNLAVTCQELDKIKFIKLDRIYDWNKKVVALFPFSELLE